jgi:signal transduction histidine kinase
MPMADSDLRYPLDRALPTSAVVGGLQNWFGYRRFAVFSLPWLRGRALVFALPIVGMGLLTFLGTWASTHDAVLAGSAAGLFVGGFMLMSFCGPLLACWVRYRRWPRRRERVAVVLAVLLGMLMAYVVDGYVSARLEPLVSERAQGSGLLSAEQKARGEALERSPIGIAINLGFLAAIYFLLGGGLALRGYFSEQRRVQESRREVELAALRLQAQQSALRLSLLQAQIAPHFLFNTLASLRALLRRDTDRAEATLDALVDHLRACMPQLPADGSVGTSTLGRELEVCRSYLELMRLRLGDRLRYSVDSAGALAERPLLPMLLLTLVENAIKHGVEPATGPVMIDVRVQPTGSALVLAVEDSGVGLQPGLGSGVGLANLRQQLRDRYGSTAALVIGGRHGGGVRAELQLPLSEAVEA